MKISSITIKKFRSIKEASFHMNDITAIVGENNAGKTGILRALNSVFNFDEERKFFLDKTHQYAPRNNSYIEVKLKDIPDKSKLLSGYIFHDEITIELKYSYSDNKRKLSVVRGNNKKHIQNLESFIEELNKFLTYVYIPAERTNHDIMWNENTIFKKLITSFLNQYTKNRDTVSSDIKRSSRRIHDTVLSKLEKQLSGLYMQNKDIGFKIDFPSDMDYTSILNYVELSISESFSNHLLKEWGSGTKSLAIIAMYRAYALIEDKDIILGIEEPEINLHPQAQKRFVQSLSRNMTESEVQTIFTTHSTVLIDELKHENILLVKRKIDSKRAFISSIKQVPVDFLNKYAIKESAHYNFFKLKNSEFFFAKHVVICESPIDAYIIKELIKPHIENDIADISFIALDGVNNLAYPYYLLKELSIPFSVVVDYDFFFDYSEQKIKDSRNNYGLPKYQDKITKIETKRRIIDDAFSKNIDKLEQAKGYRKFFELIRYAHFYSMKQCLEIDLVCSSKRARELYYKILKLPNSDNDKERKKTLLTEKYKSIKNRKNVLEVIENLQPAEYPESFKKIKNAIIEDVNCNNKLDIDS
ncbi:ATP-dependent endonuclease [Atopobium sp. oral taxon 199]|uniref:ATP-dependent nuclease n=1 Tax=Atopobium sp. oral taxon 199 TaxID=712156 RepID=UPI00034ECBF5|nr:AAA family ATPase [Atopobium sp. oral taxon 199]EPD77510.1 hypothetical protein HMPREF1527_01443 [Atopobium sp. oral taxon 199 str. F0494]